MATNIATVNGDWNTVGTWSLGHVPTGSDSSVQIHDWKAKIRIRFDADQFSTQDITNLLARAGEQVGIGEGRPDSKNSAGMGWGCFRITN